MATYARVENGVVAELFTPPENWTIGQCFHSALVWHPVPAGLSVAPGWTFDGTTWAAPEPRTAAPTTSAGQPA